MVQDTLSYSRERKQIKNNFNKAANVYDEAAVLQQTVVKQLIDRLGLIKIDPARIYDLGSGTGLSSKLLSKEYKKAQVYEIDLAFSMLQAARKNRPKLFSRQTPICAFAEKLPFVDKSAEMVFSNLMLQWCNDLDAIFLESRRVMKKGGLLIFSSLGPATLHELRQSWSVVDDNVHVITSCVACL